LPHLPLTRTGPVKFGFIIGMFVVCAGLVWALDSVSASGDPLNCWKTPDQVKPPRMARSTGLPARNDLPKGQSQTAVATKCCGWLEVETERSYRSAAKA